MSDKNALLKDLQSHEPHVRENAVKQLERKFGIGDSVELRRLLSVETDAGVVMLLIENIASANASGRDIDLWEAMYEAAERVKAVDPMFSFNQVRSALMTGGLILFYGMSFKDICIMNRDNRTELLALADAVPKFSLYMNSLQPFE